MILVPRCDSPLRRNGEEWRSDRLQLNKEVMLSDAVKRFLPLLDEVAKDFCRMLQTRVEREGRGEEGKRSLTIDPSPDLFRFALEGWGATSPPCFSSFLLAEVCIIYLYSIELQSKAGGVLLVSPRFHSYIQNHQPAYRKLSPTIRNSGHKP